MSTLSTRVDAPTKQSAYQFQLVAELCPQVMLRVLGLIAQNGLVPQQILCEQEGDELHARISVENLTADRAEILFAKMLAVIMVKEGKLKISSKFGNSENA